jgi:hypothetical protein
VNHYKATSNQKPKLPTQQKVHYVSIKKLQNTDIPSFEKYHIMATSLSKIAFVRDTITESEQPCSIFQPG